MTPLYETRGQAQKHIISQILEFGDEVDDTIELLNVSGSILRPIKPDILIPATKTSQKFMKQMLIEPCSSKISHYSRLHEEHDQVNNIIEILNTNPTSKKAVITLFHPDDIKTGYTTSWVSTQFLLRNGTLYSSSYFRSCDMINAFPYNLLGIAILQNKIRHLVDHPSLKIEAHFTIGSAHIYKQDTDLLRGKI